MQSSPGVFAFHVPNGGYRRPIEAKILQGLGVVPGVPDAAMSCSILSIWASATWPASAGSMTAG
jgi:hypothetical protein